MNKSLNNEDDLFLKDHQFNIQSQDFYQQNNQILNQPITTINHLMYNNKQQDIVSNNMSAMASYDQYGNYGYYDPLMQQQQQQQINQIPFQQQHHYQPQTDLSFLQNNDQFIQVSIDMLFDKNTSNQIKSNAFIKHILSLNTKYYQLFKNIIKHNINLCQQVMILILK